MDKTWHKVALGTFVNVLFPIGLLLSSLFPALPTAVTALGVLFGGIASTAILIWMIGDPSWKKTRTGMLWDRPAKATTLCCGIMAIGFFCYLLQLVWSFTYLPNVSPFFRGGFIFLPGFCIGVILPCMVAIYRATNKLEK